MVERTGPGELANEVQRAEHSARVAKAVSHPLRLRIVAFLGAHGAQSVTGLASRLGVNQANVSQHLRILRDQGIVVNVRQGKIVRYAVSRDCLNTLVTFLDQCSE
jgi:ArsR family transcriptional regulator